MQTQLPTTTALGSVWLLMILLPGGTEAAPTIPTKTAIIILAAIAAVYFIVCALCILIIVLWIMCSRKRTRTRCKVCPASNSQYAPQGRNNELKKPPKHGEPCPKKTLIPKEGIAVRSISQEYLRKDGGVVTYTTTAQTVTIAEKPSPDNVTVIENQWWEEGSSSSGGSRSDEVFEKQPPPSEPTSSGTIEERREEVRSSRRKKGRTDSTRPLLNGSESRGPSESGEPDTIPLSHNISYSQQAVTQDLPDYAYPKVEPPRRKKPSLDRTDSTKPLLTRSDSSEPATPTDPNPVAQNTLQAMTQDPKDYEHSKRPKQKFAGVTRKALSSGKISVDMVVTNQWYANDLPDTREEEEEEDGCKEEEEDAEGCETML